ncbi:hypothetical protein J2795_002441 [Chryseobacterium bernardetii]|uniref:Uncharacterized protein n=2 Tax=Chryseobacterium TaxID=59732 RepID=A0A543EGJ6_9FLAO|nr:MULTISPECIES: hypothetical protein [Chryseobacterium]MDR6370729.1 hypothetical protein [Chryseobacterium vietnamense]MDR6441735.1 hypothetical protein [Chryseobacterium bernardetii]TQM20686.1 hypothetical protein FB551_0360 [Chryseobacterium aquifrigidense]
MKRTIITSLFLIIACKEEKKEIKTDAQSVQTEEKVVLHNKSNEAEAAKKWLEKSIVDYFKADIGSEEKNMRKITTKDYFDYKMDAMNVDLDVDGSLTDKEFQDKWKTRFDVSKAGVGAGFLITAQDWDKIEVGSCDLELSSKDEYLFNVVLTDKNFKAEYPSVIKVVKENGSFLIADVLQDEPKSN